MPDESITLPRTTVASLIRENLPPELRVSNEARDLIVDACVEFVQMLAAEANDISNKESKKTILPDHVMVALDNLGFSEFVEPAREVYDQHKLEAQKSKRASKKVNLSELTPEEQQRLLEDQHRLLEQARQRQYQQQQESVAAAAVQQNQFMAPPQSHPSSGQQYPYNIQGPR